MRHSMSGCKWNITDFWRSLENMSHRFGVTIYWLAARWETITSMWHSLSTNFWFGFSWEVADLGWGLFLKSTLYLCKWDMWLLQKVLVNDILLKSMNLVSNPLLCRVHQWLLWLNIVILLLISSLKHITICRTVSSPVLTPRYNLLQSVFLKRL